MTSQGRLSLFTNIFALNIDRENGSAFVQAERVVQHTGNSIRGYFECQLFHYLDELRFTFRTFHNERILIEIRVPEIADSPHFGEALSL